MKIAVFGANGYIGRHLVYYLSLIKKQTITCFDIQESFDGKEQIEYIKIDITDKSQFIKCSNFDQIYFFSGVSGTKNSINNYNKFIQVNEIGLLNLLDYFKDKAVKPKIIFPSTRLVYKGSKNKILLEDAEKECKTLYATTKLVCENFLNIYQNIYGFDYSIFRRGIPNGNVIKSKAYYVTVGFVLNRANNGLPIILFGDGQLRRTFTHIMDVCLQVVEASEHFKSSGECFNLDGENYSLAEVANLIAIRYGVEVQCTEWPDVDVKLESGDTVFDSSKMREILLETLNYSVKRWLSEE